MVKGLIVIDGLNSQLLLYKGKKMFKTIKVKGEKALIVRAMNLGVKNYTDVYDRQERTYFKFSKFR